ncbi:MAG TPA: hypothetical protein PLL33_11835, partial [Paracoccus sp. (in: a-proteobacteria)]|nr:hypothetical protein [Paracoccus sp. (in: a-proteobacteria)]
ITHDLGVVAGSCERVMVMYGGRVMERAPVDPLFAAPSHPYAQGLLAAIPRVDQKGARLSAIPGSPPNMTQPPAGCPFAPRCPYVMEICIPVMPPLEAFGDQRARACHAAAERVWAGPPARAEADEPAAAQMLERTAGELPERLPDAAVAGAGSAGVTPEGGA